jgi:hypothetical protein
VPGESQATAVPGTQAPPWQVSDWVQASPSSQGAPSLSVQAVVLTAGSQIRQGVAAVACGGTKVLSIRQPGVHASSWQTRPPQHWSSRLQFLPALLQPVSSFGLAAARWEPARSPTKPPAAVPASARSI